MSDLKTSSKKPSSKPPKGPTTPKNSPKNTQSNINTAQTKPKAAPSLKELQKLWYSKLKSSGFKDLEAFDANGEPYKDKLQVKALCNIAADYRPDKAYYYSRLINYLTHNPRWASNHKVRAAIARLYVTGLSYRKISSQLRAQGLKLSIWSVHKSVKIFEAKAIVWNCTHPEGLDFQSDL